VGIIQLLAARQCLTSAKVIFAFSVVCRNTTSIIFIVYHYLVSGWDSRSDWLFTEGSA